MIAEPLPEPIEEPIIEESSPDSNSDDSDTEETRERRRLTEIRRREPSDYTKCLDYRHLSGEARKNMIRAIELQYKNSSALIRRAVLLLLEFVGKTKLNIDHLVTCWVWAKCQYLLWIFALNFRLFFFLYILRFFSFCCSSFWQDFRQLHVDQSPLVRRQLVLTLDHILSSQPSNHTVAMAWVKVILDLASDTDPKVMETVIDSFKTNIFDQIQNYENSSLLKHVFPWRLLRVMLNSKDSPDFRISMQKWMTKSLLR